VIKLLEGTKGISVVLAHTQKTAEAIIEAFMGLNADILVQEYSKEAGGADIRSLVEGGWWQNHGRNETSSSRGRIPFKLR